MDMKVVKAAMLPERAHRMEEQLREAAYNCAEDVWWDLCLDSAMALHQAMQALVYHSEYGRAMDILTALCDIEGMYLPEEAAAIQEQPELLELFMDEFLADSAEILDDFAAVEADLAGEYGDCAMDSLTIGNRRDGTQM